MPKFRVIITRDTTESVFLVVDAKTVDEAEKKALKLAQAAEVRGGPQLDYKRDECATSDPYATGYEELKD